MINLSRTLLLLIDTLRISDVGFEDRVISLLLFSIPRGTAPGSPIVRVNVVFSPSEA